MATFRCYGEHDAVEPHRSLGYSQLQLETDTAQTGLGVDWRQGPTHGDIGYLLSRHQPLEDTRSLSTGSLSRRALGNLTVDIPASTNDIWKPAQQTKT